jgi:hypothetical protein
MPLSLKGNDECFMPQVWNVDEDFQYLRKQNAIDAMVSMPLGLKRDEGLSMIIYFLSFHLLILSMH